MVSFTVTRIDYLKTIPAILIIRRKDKDSYKNKSSNATMGKSFRYDFYFFENTFSKFIYLLIQILVILA